ncbi:Hypothetical predicted protein [Octopus vulgaris]|uniref:Uncharacterized protein n=1 Tax=Octopus vulgaris TaxID=6645 RepID=A0AA36BK66_OCTVU|nr:Hypothetical predicted protein [Octopus vulgaris]
MYAVSVNHMTLSGDSCSAGGANIGCVSGVHGYGSGVDSVCGISGAGVDDVGFGDADSAGDADGAGGVGGAGGAGGAVGIGDGGSVGNVATCSNSNDDGDVGAGLRKLK